MGLIWPRCPEPAKSNETAFYKIDWSSLNRVFCNGIRQLVLFQFRHPLTLIHPIRLKRRIVPVTIHRSIEMIIEGIIVGQQKRIAAVGGRNNPSIEFPVIAPNSTAKRRHKLPAQTRFAFLIIPLGVVLFGFDSVICYSVICYSVI